jgi:putative alpha-1,2-mannosidase
MKHTSNVRIVALVAAVLTLTMTSRAGAEEQFDPTQYVNPFVGTAEHGHTFPGATVPFGMVQLSPDTGTEGWDWCSGYHWSDRSLLGFSHTHLSGTGCPDLGDILLVPQSGQLKLDPGSKENPERATGVASRMMTSMPAQVIMPSI